VLHEAVRRVEWLKVQVRYHHVVVELHVLLPNPTPAHKFDGGDDGRGHADMSSPNHNANARDLGGLAGNAAAEVGVSRAAPGFPERRAKPVDRSTGHQVRRNIRLGARGRFSIARVSAAEPSESPSLAIESLWWTLVMAKPGSSVSP